MQIAGCCLYLVRYEWMVFLSRFIVGIGAASDKLLNADINRVTTNKDKTTVTSALAVFAAVKSGSACSTTVIDPFNLVQLTSRLLSDVGRLTRVRQSGRASERRL